ncbi:MAG: hypothetical protein FJ096_17315, partial [Deltaproteobacteria bacterium]|nr:hypothetical protein [Deltaproteobacteria bacterium]
ADASCSVDGECLLARGSACDADGACATGHCADGVCCESACGSCRRCSLPGTEGSCVALPSGAPDPTEKCGEFRCDGLGHCAAGALRGFSLTGVGPGPDQLTGAARRTDGGWFVGGAHASPALGFVGGAYDVMLGAVASAGKFTPGLSFGSPLEDGVLAVAVDSQDNGYAVGLCNPGVVLTTPQPPPCSGAQRNALLVKVDATGKLAWVKSLDDTNEVDSTDDLVVGADDGVVVVGSGGAANIGGSRRGRITKVLPDGSLLWNREFGSNANYLQFRSVARVPSEKGEGDDLVMTGTFRGIATFLGATLVSVNGTDDVFVIRFDSTVQNIRWARVIGGGYPDQVTRLAVGPDGSIGLVGIFSYSINVDKNLLLIGDAQDSYVVVLDGDTGTMRWAAPVVGTADVHALAIGFDAAGNVVLGGTFQPTSGQTTGSLSLFGKDWTTAGQQDGFLAKLSATGQPLWQHTVGGPGIDRILSLRVEGDNVVAAGSTSGGYKLGAVDLTTADNLEDGALFVFGP